MIKMLKVEWIKEKRAANSALKYIVPIIFVLFNLFMVSIMGQSPAGRSYLMATAFNWYPVMILPIVLSLLVVNIVSKEKEEHIALWRRLNILPEKMLIAKNGMVVFELFTILMLSSIGIYLVGKYFLQEEISLKIMVLATCCLFIGSLPVIALSFFIYKLFNKKFLVILINFVFTFPSAMIAVTSYWKFFPWDYNLRILCPIVEVHPNGTFLEKSSPLTAMNAVYVGLVLSVMVYVIITVINIGIERGKSHV
ncbi:lantibiotic ABC transporter permease [Lachnospiraceae bacterium oral taxon 096]|nr:lantibiotic ABC transporter permease [Lachnospiraceae bacterium oral taxon 096]QUI96893.1 lantibiotic ABC transporter permease [Lachnospiraceae bacterium oral taxon 096]